MAYTKGGEVRSADSPMADLRNFPELLDHEIEGLTGIYPGALHEIKTEPRNISKHHWFIIDQNII